MLDTSDVMLITAHLKRDLIATITLKTTRQFHGKLSLYLPYDPEIPFLGNYLKEIKTFIHTKTDIRISIDALFLKAPGAPGWLDGVCDS